MELICVGFLAGAIFAVIVCGAGIIYGRSDKGQYDTDTDVRVYVPIRDRSGGSDKRDSPPDAREIVDVLYMLRIAASSREKKVIDYLIDREEKE